MNGQRTNESTIQRTNGGETCAENLATEQTEVDVGGRIVGGCKWDPATVSASIFFAVLYSSSSEKRSQPGLLSCGTHPVGPAALAASLPAASSLPRPLHVVASFAVLCAVTQSSRKSGRFQVRLALRIAGGREMLCIVDMAVVARGFFAADGFWKRLVRSSSSQSGYSSFRA